MPGIDVIAVGRHPKEDSRVEARTRTHGFFRRQHPAGTTPVGVRLGEIDRGGVMDSSRGWSAAEPVGTLVLCAIPPRQGRRMPNALNPLNRLCISLRTRALPPPLRGGMCVFPSVTTGSAAIHPWHLAVAPPGRSRGRTSAQHTNGEMGEAKGFKPRGASLPRSVTGRRTSARAEARGSSEDTWFYRGYALIAHGHENE